MMQQFAGDDDDYYRSRIARGNVLEEYEWAIIQYARENFRPERVRIFEMGAGWGMLSILLAVMGFEVVAFTGDPLYANTFRNLSKRLADLMPGVVSRLQIVENFFPDALESIPLSPDQENLLISTNVVHRLTEQNQDRILAEAMRFDQMIVDLECFGISREGGLQKQLRAWLDEGFECRGSLWRDRLLLLRPKTVVRPETQSPEKHFSWLIGPTKISNLAELRGSFRHEEGECWYVILPVCFQETSDNSAFENRSPWRLLEDGKLLGPPHAMHAEIREHGKGGYSHWNEFLLFSTSDNSDPRKNGRVYSLARARWH